MAKVLALTCSEPPDEVTHWTGRAIAAWVGISLRSVQRINARLRDELLNGEIFYTLREAQVVIESWRRHYNGVRPHASLRYRPPAPEVFVPAFSAWLAALARPAPPAKLLVAERPTVH